MNDMRPGRGAARARRRPRRAGRDAASARPTRSARWCGTSRSTLRRGEAVGLLGPNGAGKTTTFYMIVGLVQPDAGAISSTARTSRTLPMYRRARLGIGYLPQEASVFRGLNVEQNIMAALEVVEPDRATAATCCWTSCWPSSASRHLRRTPALALSGGERRRVRDRPRAGDPAGLHPARRAARRHRPDRGRRNPRSGVAPEGPRHRRADHRPQCARDAGDHRPRLHHARRPGADGGRARTRSWRTRTCAASISAKGSAFRRPLSACRYRSRSCRIADRPGRA